jgi:hypothetical protein
MAGHSRYKNGRASLARSSVILRDQGRIFVAVVANGAAG